MSYVKKLQSALKGRGWDGKGQAMNEYTKQLAERPDLITRVDIVNTSSGDFPEDPEFPDRVVVITGGATIIHHADGQIEINREEC